MDENEEELTYECLFNKRKSRVEDKKSGITPQEREDQAIDWCTFFRRNWNIYAKNEEIGLGIKSLHFFQEVAIYLMGVSQVFYMMCSRGLSKSWMSALGAFILCMLYPYSEVVLTATTIKTAKKMVKNKMEEELCHKMSPKLKYLYDNRLIVFEYKPEEIKVTFKFNKSWILILPETDSSRGERATCVILEEARLLRKKMVDDVFIPMKRPRQALYLYDDKYTNDKRLLEECRIFYLTSTRYKYEWFWDRWKVITNSVFNSTLVKNNIFAGDIFTAIKHNLKTEVDFIQEKSTMSEIDIRMEYYNEPIGEVEGAYYTLESFKRNSVIPIAFNPPTSRDILLKKDLGNRPKQVGEVRILFIDFAFKDTTTVEKNDNTVIGCMSGSLSENGEMLIRGVDYIETHTGSKTELAKLRIRELFVDYDADYIVPDFRNGGELIFRDNLSRPFHHPERHKGDNSKDLDYEEWHGLGICNKDDLQLLGKADLDDFRKYTIDPNAIPCIIPFKGEIKINDKCHTSMQTSLRYNKIHFLVDEMDFDNRMSEDEDWLMLSPNERAVIKLPYIRTGMLIEEAINLTAKFNSGLTILEESRNGTKDMIVACEYGNYVMSLIENKMARKGQSVDFDIADYSWMKG